ncbi:MAG: alpha/beta fold hydrolase [Chloroflexi bacterium]|nr:alpha/beta fold hydrolase [Chloroflexota bacterium]
MILVHGLSGSTLWWIRNVRSLAQHYRVYLVDLPGFGAMRRAPGRFVLAKAGSWLLAWMEAIGVKQAHFIGHSMGGYICMLLAAHQPEAVSRLILVSPAVKAHVHSVVGYFVPLLSTVYYLKPSFLPILTYDALRAGPLTLLRATQQLVELDVSQEIKAVTAPTLLVWGENDTLVPPALGYFLRQELANARLLSLRAGHISMYEQAEQFNAAVLAFLRGELVGE